MTTLEIKNAKTCEILRNAILKLNPKDIGLQQTTDFPDVWGSLMEMKLGQHLVTLVVLLDGTTSLYLGDESGFIGCGENQNVRKASMDFLKYMQQNIQEFISTNEICYPKNGEVRFHIFTYQDILTAHGNENMIITNNHLLSPFFQKANNVLTEIRKLNT